MDTLIIVALLVLVVTYWTGSAWRPRPLPGVARARPWALGHRGVRGLQPENSMAAFRAALEAGLDGVETDVQRTRDGQLVLVHDTEVAGLRVVDATLEELRVVVPAVATLAELLELVREHPGTLLNVELKTFDWRGGAFRRVFDELSGVHCRALAQAVAGALRGSGLEDRLVVSSFSPVALFHLRRFAPSLRTAYLWEDDPKVPWPWNRPWPGALLHVDALHPKHLAVTPEAVRRWHARGLLVNTWTVNEASDVTRVVEAGVDGVMADDPDELLAALGRAGG